MDLRAGTSELTAPILLDPRVHRVFVATVSDQAVRGTRQDAAMSLLARRPTRPDRSDPACAVLVTQFKATGHQDDLGEGGRAAATGALDESRPAHAAESAGGTRSDPGRSRCGQPILLSPFHSSLLSLQRVGTRCYDIATRRPASTTSSDPWSRPAQLRSPAWTNLLSRRRRQSCPRADTGARRSRPARRRLERLAKDLVLCRDCPVHGGFLVTEAAANLVAAHGRGPHRGGRRRPKAPARHSPISTSVGAVLEWATFARAAREFRGESLTAPVVPVLASHHPYEQMGDRPRTAEECGRSIHRRGGRPGWRASVA